MGVPRKKERRRALVPVECHMTDISVIKMIISVADEEFIGHGFMTKLRVWEGLGHRRVFSTQL